MLFSSKITFISYLLKSIELITSSSFPSISIDMKSIILSLEIIFLKGVLFALIIFIFTSCQNLENEKKSINENKKKEGINLKVTSPGIEITN